MGETLANRTKRLKRAAERQQRRKAVIAAIAELGLNDLRNWSVAAAALNAKGVRTELGRAWTKRVIIAFVRKQVSKGKGLHGGGWDKALSEDLLFDAVRKYCRGAANYGEAAGILNARGILSASGREWTAKLAKGFMQRHWNSGLMPLAGRRGRAAVGEAAAKVMRGMKPDPVLTWEGIAAALNAKGVECPGGGRWNVAKLLRFVEAYWKRNGERLFAWKKDETGKGRPMGAVLERHARDAHAERVMGICGEVRDYDAAADKLNRKGCRTRMGNVWTGQRLRAFVKHYEMWKGKS
jgi:hypothetical protein